MSIATLLHSHVAFSLPTLTSRRRNAVVIYAVSAPPEEKASRGGGSGRNKKQIQRNCESEIGLPNGFIVSHAFSNDSEGAATCGISEVAFATFENMEYEEDYMKTDTETYNWVIHAHTRAGAESYNRYIEEGELTGDSKRSVPRIGKTPLDPDGFAYSKPMETSFKQRCLDDWRIHWLNLFKTSHNEGPANLGEVSESDYMRVVESLENIIKDCIKPDTESYDWMVQLYTRAESHAKGVFHGRKNSLYEASNGLHGSIELVSTWLKEWSQLNIVKVAGLVACAFLIIPSADAIDALKTCTCLLKECRIELAKCIANPSCAANIACLQTCNNRPDETECQIKCGDLFENSVGDEFNECAVSRKKCVPRKSDVGEFPVPDPAVLVKSFNLADFTGKWFITSGLNPTFDAFDCQLHEFRIESNKLVGNLTWRIRTPDTAFFTRSAVQKFVQDPLQPGILYNHDNEYLHYQDDWYILSSKIANEADDYVFVYYRGRNDAWDGYGGAVIYTRSATLPESIVPELERATKSIGRDFSTFIRTDNTCGPEPPLVERIEKTVEEGERTIIKEVEEIEEEVAKVGKTEVTLFQRLLEGFKELRQDEENFLQGLSKEETELLSELKMEAEEVEKLFGRALPIRKLR